VKKWLCAIYKYLLSAWGLQVKLTVFTWMTHELVSAQPLFREARGVHSAALSDSVTYFLQSENIGRLNALDKIARRLQVEAFRHPSRVYQASNP
jgi:formate dehydrogenase assembly factor FdhD